jgi:hypothetical protein
MRHKDYVSSIVSKLKTHICFGAVIEKPSTTMTPDAERRMQTADQQEQIHFFYSSQIA